MSSMVRWCHFTIELTNYRTIERPVSKKIILTMPQPGETITEGHVVRWLVLPGASVREGQPIVELETEKAVFEYESPYEGNLSEIVAADGSTVAVGNPIAVFDVAEEKAKTYLMLGLGKSAEEKEIRKEVTKKVLFSPVVRKLIREHNLKNEEVEQISKKGRITKEEILAYLDKKSKKKGSSSPGEEVIPLSPVRLRIAENMALSKKTIPHAHTGQTIDLTSLVRYREEQKKSFQEKEGISLGILPLIFPSLKKAVAKHPLVNASFVEQSNGEKAICVHHYVNLGMAVDTPRGLYVVVIRDAHKMGFGGFARSLADAVDRAKKNRLKPDDLTGMTFTFNNYGFYGTRFGVQIILPPQSTTLGMGKIEKRPWVVGDKIEIRELSDFTMAFDHRVMDGGEAGLFLSSLKKSLENFSENDLK